MGAWQGGGGRFKSNFFQKRIQRTQRENWTAIFANTFAQKLKKMAIESHTRKKKCIHKQRATKEKKRISDALQKWRGGENLPGFNATLRHVIREIIKKNVATAAKKKNK